MKIFMLVAILSTAVPLSAQEKPTVTTTTSLQEMCEAHDRIDAAKAANDFSHVKTNDWAADGFCLGYIDGVTAALDGSTRTMKNSKYTLHFVRAFTVGRVEKLFMAYVAQHPEELDFPPTMILTQALAEAGFLEVQ
ncbi:MAG: Rap1a/Tai family immunity protein [Candidatus Acidiferrales bacterium]